MSVRMFWEDEREDILRYEVEGEWTWNELYMLYNQAEVNVERVDVIAHFSADSRIPADMMLHLSTIASMQEPNVGLCVIVTRNDMLRRMVNTAAKLYPHTRQIYRTAISISEAQAIIAADRAAQAE